jgi:hypothetical protein
VTRKASSSARTSSLASLRLILLLAAVLVPGQGAIAQTQAPAQPLNANVSDFGTSFAFSPPICPGCFETELGYLYLQDGHYAPAVVTVAPTWLHGDASVLVNALDSEAPNGHRVTHFGNRLDFAIRWKVLDRNGFILTATPWGTAFVRGIQGGRAGAVLLPQYTWGKNQIIAEFVLTGAVGVSAGNPRTDYQESFDYTRTVGSRGYAVFAGMLHELSGGANSIGTEIGGVIPFRNGQIELATEQLTLNSDPTAQVQARVIVNWGKLLSRRH